MYSTNSTRTEWLVLSSCLSMDGSAYSSFFKTVIVSLTVTVSLWCLQIQQMYISKQVRCRYFSNEQPTSFPSQGQITWPNKLLLIVVKSAQNWRLWNLNSIVLKKKNSCTSFFTCTINTDPSMGKLSRTAKINVSYNLSSGTFSHDWLRP